MGVAVAVEQDATPSKRERAAQLAEERAQLRKAKRAARRRRRLRERERRKAQAVQSAPQVAGDGDSEAPAAGVHKRRRKVREGVVTSARADKTIVVRVERQQPHPVYGKIVRTSKKFHAHDERNEAREGDVVRIVESRPLSRTKRWRLLEILERAR